jgi:hypothetical protein
MTQAERVVIRSLAAMKDDFGFDPSALVRAALRSERLHTGTGTEAAVEALLAGNGDPMAVAESDRKLVAEILLRDETPLTAELVEGALAALRRRQLEHRLRELNQRITAAERASDSASLTALLQDKVQLTRELRAISAVPERSVAQEW